MLLPPLARRRRQPHVREPVAVQSQHLRQVHRDGHGRRVERDAVVEEDEQQAEPPVLAAVDHVGRRGRVDGEVCEIRHVDVGQVPHLDEVLEAVRKVVEDDGREQRLRARGGVGQTAPGPHLDVVHGRRVAREGAGDVRVVVHVELDGQRRLDAAVAQVAPEAAERRRAVGVLVHDEREAVAAADVALLVELEAEVEVAVPRAVAAVVRDLERERALEAALDGPRQVVPDGAARVGPRRREAHAAGAAPVAGRVAVPVAQNRLLRQGVVLEARQRVRVHGHGLHDVVVLAVDLVQRALAEVRLVGAVAARLDLLAGRRRRRAVQAQALRLVEVDEDEVRRRRGQQQGSPHIGPRRWILRRHVSPCLKRFNSPARGRRASRGRRRPPTRRGSRRRRPSRARSSPP